MSKKPVIGGAYQHFKGKRYYVLDIVWDCTREKEVVLYCSRIPLSKAKYFVRDIEDFNSNISKNRSDNITGQTKRFVLIRKPQNSEGEEGRQ